MKVVLYVLAIALLAPSLTQAEDYACPDERAEELRVNGIWAKVAYDKKEAGPEDTLDILASIVGEATRPNEKEAFEQSCSWIAEILTEEGMAESHSSALEGCPDDALEKYVEGRDRAELVGGEDPYLPIIRVSPAYPEAAIDQKLSGEVVVEFTVTRKGRAEAPVVIESSNEVFDEAALAAVERFHYKPRKEGRKKIAVPGVRTVISFNYNAFMQDRVCR